MTSAYRLVYASKSEKNGGILKHFYNSLISDLFEREESKQIRLKRERERAEKALETSGDESNQSDDVKPTHLATRNRCHKKLRNFDFAVFCAQVGYLFWFGPARAHLPVIAFSSAIFWIYRSSLPHLFQQFPLNFTFGEGCLVLQGCLLYVFEAVVTLALDTEDSSTLEGSFCIIAKAGVLSCALHCILPRIPGCHWAGRTTWYFAMGLLILGAFTLPFLWWSLKRDPIFWVLELIFSSKTWLILMASWTACVVLSIVVVNSQTQAGRKASTRVRKYFHGLVVVVFTSGTIFAPHLLFLGSCVALCVFMVLECIRIYKIDPFSNMLNGYFSIFLDEKDQGKLVLSNIYLLVGCSAPLWLAHSLEGAEPVVLLSGVLAIGIGDSAASVVGSKYGRTKFSDSPKSIEGTLASIVSQLAFLLVLSKLRLISVTSWTVYYLPIFISALVEALTSQFDNLVLPLILYILL